MSRRTHTVSQVARLTGVTVRTLHHYDAIGLLKPSGRTDKGYRSYDASDLLRLQQVLLRRSMGWPLERIRRSLDDPDFDLRAGLLEARAWLLDQRAEMDRRLRAVDAALAALDEEEKDAMKPEDLFQGFDPEAHRAEVDARWGDTEAHRASSRRTESYGPDDWAAIQTEAEAIYRELAELAGAAAAPTAPEVLALVERHRCHIDRWFYPCSPEMHAQLADLWSADGRFQATMDRAGPGVTVLLAAGARVAGGRDRADPPT